MTMHAGNRTWWSAVRLWNGWHCCLIFWADAGCSAGEYEIFRIYFCMSPHWCNHYKRNLNSPSVSSATVCCLRRVGLRIRGDGILRKPYPKYRKGHILKCFTGRFSSFSAKDLSFRGRPRPLAAGALDRVCFTPTGVACRISWLSTSSSCCREQGAQVHPYPRDGFAISGGCTHRMWKYFLQRSHNTESALYTTINMDF
jgi:hypothetical protein